MRRLRAYLVIAFVLLFGSNGISLYRSATEPRVEALTLSEHAATLAAQDLRRPIDARVSSLERRLDDLAKRLEEAEVARESATVEILDRLEGLARAKDRRR